MSKLSVDIKVGETLFIGGAQITLVAKSGGGGGGGGQGGDEVAVVTPKQLKSRTTALNANTEHTTHG